MSPAEATWSFSGVPIEERQNTEANCISSGGLGSSESQEIDIAFPELLEGAEAQGNFYYLVGRAVSARLQQRAEAARWRLLREHHPGIVAWNGSLP